MNFRSRIECPDGFSISVQSHSGSYCLPRRDNCEIYTHVECGFPSSEDMTDELISYAECGEDLTETVYGYVPIEIVVSELDKHGLKITAEELIKLK